MGGIGLKWHRHSCLCSDEHQPSTSNRHHRRSDPDQRENPNHSPGNLTRESHFTHPKRIVDRSFSETRSHSGSGTPRGKRAGNQCNHLAVCAGWSSHRAAPTGHSPLRLLSRRALLHCVQRTPRLGLRGPASADCADRLDFPARARQFAGRLSSAPDPGRRRNGLSDGLARRRARRRQARPVRSGSRDSLRAAISRIRQHSHHERVRASLLAGVCVHRRANREWRLAEAMAAIRTDRGSRARK